MVFSEKEDIARNFICRRSWLEPERHMPHRTCSHLLFPRWRPFALQHAALLRSPSSHSWHHCCHLLRQPGTWTWGRCSCWIQCTPCSPLLSHSAEASTTKSIFPSKMIDIHGKTNSMVLISWAAEVKSLSCFIYWTGSSQLERSSLLLNDVTDAERHWCHALSSGMAHTLRCNKLIMNENHLLQIISDGVSWTILSFNC